MGYTEVELAGFAGTSSVAMRHALDAAGLRAVSAHIPFVELRERLAAVIEELQIINCPQAVLPWIPPPQRANAEALAQLGEQCNAIGAELAAHEIAFTYHNEDYDFLPFGESSIWHMLAKHTDPRFVTMQLDLVTATLAGSDVLAVLREYGPRIISLHVCDVREGVYVPIGTGTLDWQRLLQAAQTTAVKRLIIEQDGSMHPFADAAESLVALQGLQSALDKPVKLC